MHKGQSLSSCNTQTKETLLNQGGPTWYKHCGITTKKMREGERVKLGQPFQS